MNTTAESGPVSAILTWDPDAIAQNVVDQLREDGPPFDVKEALTLARQDTKHLSEKWDALLVRLNEFLLDLSPRGHFVGVRPNLPAVKFHFTATGASEFLHQLLPDARCKFTIGRKDDTLYVSATSAGEPTEVYLVTADPISSSHSPR